MDWHNKSSEELLSYFKSSLAGLSEKEASNRIKKYGKNSFKEYKKKSRVFLFLKQFNSLLIYILLASFIISILIGHFIDGIVILAIVIINSSIGFFQEYKAEEIIEKLKKSLQYKIVVLRNGVQKEIDSVSIVPGDIIIYDSGDKILADCRIISCENLKVNESVLTGESFPIDKSEKVLEVDIALADRKNMLYAGTVVLFGKCKAIVVGTGSNTEFGKLAELVQTTTSEKMPIEKKLNDFSRNISIAILIFVSIAFFYGIYKGIDKLEMFLVSVSLAIGAIPEGLPAIIAITLAVAIKRMYKVNTLVRKLPAAETLGRATVICTDKTGTLTKEELTVDMIYSSSREIKIEDTIKVDQDFRKLIEVGLLCNNARDEDDNIIGDPTEASLIEFGNKFSFSKKELTSKNPRIKEFPFDSERKMMSIIRQNGNIKTSYVKGASQEILQRCTKELINSKIVPISKERRKELLRVSKRMESLGLRVLGFAFKQITKVDQNNAENLLIFAGFVGMIDPPRPEVREAILEAICAGIKIKIITGDSALTTLAIAKKVGIEGEIIEGRELEKIPEHKWSEIVKTKTIFARITPEQKLKIVDTLRNQNETVAVTGDGVNDILALKKADIGVSMGIRGSDVARDSSDIVLMDDNFSSIVKAVREGRGIFDNLRKTIRFLLSVNVANTFIIIFSLMIGFPLPFLPLAILWMNLATDSLPALALAVEGVEDDVMKRKPINKGLLSGNWQWILIAGIINFLMVIYLFIWSLGEYNLDVARTIALTSSVFLALFMAFSFRTEKSLFKINPFGNKYLVYSLFGVSLLQILAIYSPLASIFGFVKLNSTQLIISIVSGFLGAILIEMIKPFRKRFISD